MKLSNLLSRLEYWWVGWRRPLLRKLRRFFRAGEGAKCLRAAWIVYPDYMLAGAIKRLFGWQDQDRL